MCCKSRTERERDRERERERAKTPEQGQTLAHNLYICASFKFFTNLNGFGCSCVSEDIGVMSPHVRLCVKGKKNLLQNGTL